MKILEESPRKIRLSFEARESLGKTVATRAIEIVRQYFQRKGWEVMTSPLRDGSDFHVKKKGRVQKIEVKGTASIDIALQELWVSSQLSHDLLVNGREPMYRVTGANGRFPVIYVLRHPDDFELTQEPMWRASSPSHPAQGRR